MGDENIYSYKKEILLQTPEILSPLTTSGIASEKRCFEREVRSDTKGSKKLDDKIKSKNKPPANCSSVIHDKKSTSLLPSRVPLSSRKNPAAKARLTPKQPPLQNAPKHSKVPQSP